MTFVTSVEKAEAVEFDLAWLAGLFDGEGSIGVYKRNWDRTHKIQYYTLTVCLAQSGKWGKVLVDSLQKVYGGHVRYAPGKAKKDMYHWQVDAEKAVTFLAAIDKYLWYKQEQAALAFEFQELKSKRVDDPAATSLHDKLKELKRV